VYGKMVQKSCMYKKSCMYVYVTIWQDKAHVYLKRTKLINVHESKLNEGHGNNSWLMMLACSDLVRKVAML